MAVLVFTYVKGQDTFEKSYNISPSDAGKSILKIDGGYLICGETLGELYGGLNIFVSKVDDNGELIWTKIYTDMGQWNEYVTYVMALSDGSFLLVGSILDVYYDVYDALVLKIAADGTKLWAHAYNRSAIWNPRNAIANYVIESSDGNYYVCGSSAQEGFSDMDMWLFKITSSGSLVEENFYGSNGNDIANRMLQLADGSLIIVGKVYDEVNEDIDGAVIKTNISGGEFWEYYTSGLGDEEFNDIIMGNNEDILIVGSQKNENNGDIDILLENLPLDGTTLNYSFTFDYNGGDDRAFRVYLNSDNECFIAGRVEDTSTEDTDAYIAYVNVNKGEIEGDILYGGIYDDTFYDFDTTSDNGFVCVGKTEINEDGDTDIYLVKIDEDGVIGVSESLNSVDDFRIHPNPVKDILSIQISQVDKVNYTIENISGQSIQNGELQKSIDVSGLKAGVYLLKVDNGKQSISQKFIKIN